eukprot:TRINITY_DN70962_c0_g1_i1.p1 TRINITY_DN70962_c0_g1~~TRINITY_DN70962_c0_g1_i1.p1  ORF type:complete len:114 (+),score=23.83 TRINITY_DN70962_c0_g1_i1:3-344(+)
MYRCDYFFTRDRRPPKPTQGVSSAASDVYKRQSSDKQKAMQRYSQRFPDGVYRVNVTGRIACIKMKKKGDSSSSAQNIYVKFAENKEGDSYICLLYTSPSPRDLSTSRMPSSA